MSELSQSLDVPDTITHEGITYQISGITLEVMAQFEDWLERETLDELNRLFPNAVGDIIKAMGSMIAEGMFEFFGPVAQVRLGSLSGRKKLTLFRIRVNHPATDEKTIGDMVESQWVEILKLIQKEQAELKNGQSPAKPGDDTNAPSDGPP